jgi:uncharacterized membrane protein YwzB
VADSAAEVKEKNCIGIRYYIILDNIFIGYSIHNFKFKYLNYLI